MPNTKTPITSNVNYTLAEVGLMQFLKIMIGLYERYLENRREQKHILKHLTLPA